MIYSMTAYARHELQDDEATVCWDIRSVNHKYLDLSFKLPEELRSLEFCFREIAKKNIKRGKLDCHLRINLFAGNHKTLDINVQLAKQVIAACQQLATNMQAPAPISPLDILQWPYMTKDINLPLEHLEQLATEALTAVLTKLKESKQQEGKELLTVILNRLNEMELQVQEINNLLPNTIYIYRQRLLNKLKDLSVAYDEGRLEQELLYLAQKIDVAEELDRLKIHIDETRHILNEGGMLGRRIDFFMQELNREVNTLSAKSIDPKISLVVVELKILIEQIREQSQNLE